MRQQSPYWSPAGVGGVPIQQECGGLRPLQGFGLSLWPEQASKGICHSERSEESRCPSALDSSLRSE